MPDLRRTALEYMGQSNPLIKAPLEQLFDTQFHTQRKLSDLRAPAAASAIGRLFNEENPQLLSQVMVNSPLTRFVTSADKIMDNRKDWATKVANLFSGARITDVDVDKTRAIDLRNNLDRILQEQPHLSRYTRFYVKPELAANLTPQEIEMVRLYAGVQRRAQQYAKEKRAEAGRIGVGP